MRILQLRERDFGGKPVEIANAPGRASRYADAHRVEVALDNGTVAVLKDRSPAAAL